MKSRKKSAPGTRSAFTAETAASAPDRQSPPALSSQSPLPALEALFTSARVQGLKLQICDIGRRMWQRGYVDGNGGNMAVRVGADLAICTPTLVSKGSLQPQDLCLVDFAGHQILGAKKHTSEILMHLQMMQRQPRAMATCHCHPPHATAFAIVGRTPPPGLLPEFELFCSVALAPYRTPGSPAMARVVARLAPRHDTILLANHGVVAWSPKNIEEAYWRIEIIDTYCQTVAIARQLGKPLKALTSAQRRELRDLKRNFNSVDPDYG